MNAGAKGVKIICSGRLAGSEMARRESQKLGSIPLHTLDANVDYAVATSRTTYGAIGIKVWIYKGKYGEEPEPSIRRRAGVPKRTAPARKRSRSKAATEQKSKGTKDNHNVVPLTEAGAAKQSGTGKSIVDSELKVNSPPSQKGKTTD